ADAAEWTPPRPLDGVLVDAPCTATGTIRRHPDLPWRKDADAADERTPMQDRLLDAAAGDLGPGGVLVYCVCSLDPREGEARVERLLGARADLVRAPVAAAEIGGIADAITAAGDVRSLPHLFPSPGGWDGFYIARLRRQT
ncbi:MAG: MFS transporter, partial [Proteobacteria bacterium]|nr:MFS transporter [Pseudomonadota bacterium]